MGELAGTEQIARRILLLRGHRVMLDADLAELYGVPTKALNQAVRRNKDRFPPDFMFRLTKQEKTEVVTNCDHLQKLKFSPVLPYAFTEHGAVMLANILNAPRAIKVSVYVVRAFAWCLSSSRAAGSDSAATSCCRPRRRANASPPCGPA
jgi:hypothetical protein